MIAALSLVFLVAVIVIGVLTKKNCGVIGILAAVILALVANAAVPETFEIKKILSGNWPTGLFMYALSTTFLFAVANVNGTTKKLSENIVCLSGGNNRLIPLAFFVGGAIISAAGAGGLVVAVIAPIALYVAVANGIPVMMMSFVTMGGIMVGGLSPLAINGVVAKSLIATEGIENYTPFWAAYAVSMTVFSLIIYLAFGGLTCKAKESTEKPQFVALDKNQAVTIAAIVADLLCVIFLKQDIGVMSFVFACALVLFNAADQKKVFAAIPWSTLVLICGMSVMISVVKTAGGIELLTTGLESVMTARTAQPFMVLLGGLMGAVSSGTGVVMPTLIPLCTTLSQSLGTVSATTMMIGVIVGTNGVVISPLSTVGGLCVAGAPDGVNKDKLYNQLLLGAICFIALNFVASFVGLFGIFG